MHSTVTMWRRCGQTGEADGRSSRAGNIWPSLELLRWGIPLPKCAGYPFLISSSGGGVGECEKDKKWPWIGALGEGVLFCSLFSSLSRAHMEHGQSVHPLAICKWQRRARLAHGKGRRGTGKSKGGSCFGVFFFVFSHTLPDSTGTVVVTSC